MAWPTARSPRSCTCPRARCATTSPRRCTRSEPPTGLPRPGRPAMADGCDPAFRGMLDGAPRGGHTRAMVEEGVTPTELADRLREANARIAELESARLRAETLLAVTRVLGKTLTLEDTFEAI